jgi:hypothetical protein
VDNGRPLPLCAHAAPQAPRLPGGSNKGSGCSPWDPSAPAEQLGSSLSPREPASGRPNAAESPLAPSRQHASNADAERWGILGVGLMPWDRKMYDTLKKQDCLYTLLLRGNASSDARVIGAIHDFLLVPDEPEPCLQTLSSACAAACGNEPSALFDDGAASASLDRPKAGAAPPHPGAPPEQREKLAAPPVVRILPPQS